MLTRQSPFFFAWLTSCTAASTRLRLLQVKFDLHSPQSTATVPPVLYSTLDGCFCVAQDAAAAAAEAAMQGSSFDYDSSRGGLVGEVLHREPYAILSFDVDSTYGRSVLAATDNEHVMVLQMDDQQHMQS